MKLALIVPGGFHPGGRDNVIPALVGLAEELACRRHEVHVFAFGGPGRVTRHRQGGAEIHQLGDSSTVDPPRRGRNLRLLARLSRQLTSEVMGASARGPFQVLHAFWANEPGLLAGALGRALGVPVVVSIGGGEAVRLPEVGYGGRQSRPGQTMLGLALGLAQAITAGSQFALSFLPARVAARAAVVPLGIDGRLFAAEPDRPSGPPFRLLHVGSINRVKDHPTLLRAMARLIADGYDVTLDCVGEDTLCGRTQAETRALGLWTRVRFHGHLPNPELAPLYQNAHLLVVSSRYESQSVAVLEAAAAGLATVGTAVGLLAEMAPIAASVVTPGNPPALAGAIAALLSDEKRRRAMAEAAQTFGRAHDVAATARRFEDLYARLGGALPRRRSEIAR